MVVEALTAAMLCCAATNENRSPVFLDAAFINNDVISVKFSYLNCRRLTSNRNWMCTRCDLVKKNVSDLSYTS